MLDSLFIQREYPVKKLSIMLRINSVWRLFNLDDSSDREWLEWEFLMETVPTEKNHVR